MTNIVKAKTTQKISDAGTGTVYEADTEYEFEAGVFANYAAAGLVVAVDDAPATSATASTAKDTTAKDASTDTTKAKI